MHCGQESWRLGKKYSSDSSENCMSRTGPAACKKRAIAQCRSGNSCGQVLLIETIHYRKTEEKFTRNTFMPRTGLAYAQSRYGHLSPGVPEPREIIRTRNTQQPCVSAAGAVSVLCCRILCGVLFNIVDLRTEFRNMSGEIAGY